MKKCPHCQEIVKGRADKKYCSDACKNNYNHSLNKGKRAENYKNKKEQLIHSYRVSKETNRERYILTSTKARAKKLGIPFNLELEDIIIPIYCPLLGIRLKHYIGRENSSPSIDKIDPSLGYVKGNVWIISFKANRCKSNLTVEELLLFCETMLNKIAVCKRLI
jgi:hypothetical protein